MKKELLLLGALFVLVTTSCRGHLPEAPKIDFCAHSFESKGFVCIKPDETVYFLKYEEALNFIAQSPSDADKVNSYVLGLEKEVYLCRQKP